MTAPLSLIKAKHGGNFIIWGSFNCYNGEIPPSEFSVPPVTRSDLRDAAEEEIGSVNVPLTNWQKWCDNVNVDLKGTFPEIVSDSWMHDLALWIDCEIDSVQRVLRY